MVFEFGTMKLYWKCKFFAQGEIASRSKSKLVAAKRQRRSAITWSSQFRPTWTSSMVIGSTAKTCQHNEQRWPHYFTYSCQQCRLCWYVQSECCLLYFLLYTHMARSIDTVNTCVSQRQTKRWSVFNSLASHIASTYVNSKGDHIYKPSFLFVVCCVTEWFLLLCHFSFGVRTSTMHPNWIACERLWLKTVLNVHSVLCISFVSVYRC